MGVPSSGCDDGEHGIEIDWDPRSMKESICLSGEPQVYDQGRHADIQYIDRVEEPSLMMMHVCLDTPIVYNTSVPLSGDHRPLWPVFGEYRYLPPQRWVHSLEHGAVALLYNPCTFNSRDIDVIKGVVRGCIWKHVITPYKHIPENMPYALLTYGHMRLLNHFRGEVTQQEVKLVTDFIKDTALRGPESAVLKDGQYSAGLLQPSDHSLDTRALCPDR
ncbi:hypothetical protein DPMN_014781 [Dreissena polymorpha]|uniref:DUF3105 domain-containing protein n=2 Tax=Dreissena polymorpha TaxID=45954 RepID=A0A9D4NAC1_DREPO|nr:hypothetical protein DPMN_014781 [Dreissena polymorpha]